MNVWDGPTEFEWDSGNIFKAWMGHKVLPLECEEAFTNHPRFGENDPKHSEREARHFFYGRTDKGRLLTIVYTMRGGKIRVISPRDMSQRERARYDAAVKRHTGV